MSACSACIDANPIPECVTNLTIGSITDTYEPVYVYIKNVSTDMIERLATTTGGGGLVTLTSIDNTWLNPGSFYEAWVVLQSATNIDVGETITNGTNTGTCINFTVNAIFGDDEFQEEYTNITMTS